MEDTEGISHIISATEDGGREQEIIDNQDSQESLYKDR